MAYFEHFNVRGHNNESMKIQGYFVWKLDWRGLVNHILEVAKNKIMINGAKTIYKIGKCLKYTCRLSIIIPLLSGPKKVRASIDWLPTWLWCVPNQGQGWVGFATHFYNEPWEGGGKSEYTWNNCLACMYGENHPEAHATTIQNTNPIQASVLQIKTIASMFCLKHNCKKLSLKCFDGAIKHIVACINLAIDTKMEDFSNTKI